MRAVNGLLLMVVGIALNALGSGSSDSLQRLRECQALLTDYSWHRQPPDIREVAYNSLSVLAQGVALDLPDRDLTGQDRISSILALGASYPMKGELQTVTVGDRGDLNRRVRILMEDLFVDVQAELDLDVFTRGVIRYAIGVFKLVDGRQGEKIRQRAFQIANDGQESQGSGKHFNLATLSEDDVSVLSQLAIEGLPQDSVERVSVVVQAIFHTVCDWYNLPGGPGDQPPRKRWRRRR